MRDIHEYVVQVYHAIKVGGRGGKSKAHLSLSLSVAFPAKLVFNHRVQRISKMLTIPKNYK